MATGEQDLDVDCAGGEGPSELPRVELEGEGEQGEEEGETLTEALGVVLAGEWLAERGVLVGFSSASFSSGTSDWLGSGMGGIEGEVEGMGTEG